ncbi:VOC family protein [Spirillospora sp. NPDC049024]|uniref:VOC family protein n=1 Tax=unclassified Actinomadura TaxID=2626254 RepID=UPI0011F069EB|nr:VOC family protein [Actinomadura sp. K4S16]
MNLFPKLVVDDAVRAVEFFTTALGVKETERSETPDGKIVNVRLALGDVQFTLKDEDSVDAGPTALGLDRSPVIINLEVPDPDEVAARMEAGGATVIYPVEDHPYGRMGRLRDPFGHVWIVRRTPSG